MTMTMTERDRWANSAARRRALAKFRRHLCRLLGAPIDSCYTTGELLRDARRERPVKVARRQAGGDGVPELPK